MGPPTDNHVPPMSQKGADGRLTDGLVKIFRDHNGFRASQHGWAYAKAGGLHVWKGVFAIPSGLANLGAFAAPKLFLT